VILASTLTTNLAILVLAGFVGFIVISKIPNTLHTPLMSGTNAIHGIVVLGGLLLLGLPGLSGFSEFLLVIAVAFGTINVVGGFLVTDRMLEMFKRKPGEGARAATPPAPKEAPAGADGAAPQREVESESRTESEPESESRGEPESESEPDVQGESDGQSESGSPPEEPPS
jgi:NAD(P) transhydrogenase subunit alpha